MRLYLVLALSLAASVLTLAAGDGSREALGTWDAYLERRIRAFETSCVRSTALFPVKGEQIAVQSVTTPSPWPVREGLIHDWVAVGVIPNTHLPDVLRIVRDYDHYSAFYGPLVTRSWTTFQEGDIDRFSLEMVNRSLFSRAAVRIEYQTQFTVVDGRNAYNRTRSTSIQEIAQYGEADARVLPPGESSGYIRGVQSLARFAECEEGVLVEMEAVVLSREIPVGLHWIVEPMVRRIARNTLTTSLTKTRIAVQQEADRHSVRTRASRSTKLAFHPKG